MSLVDLSLNIANFNIRLNINKEKVNKIESLDKVLRNEKAYNEAVDNIELIKANLHNMNIFK
ncbi:hypothetical protein F8154_00370 [Alkaliphilus pronyensis]|uniref:Uncharacterized protein n=1 Tax=Alkaliphilus pronyensis TaxID=1482732 RepID=A0A6I0FP53_9FIRM|nr:hypothetical protein [Alkaliphilus pronyensis]KAB3541006.1 hypothetical protein F8154_00370 [Alkaliphilus pronyensis]